MSNVVPFKRKVAPRTLHGALLDSIEMVAARNERRAVIAFLLARGLHDEAKAIEEGGHL